MSRADRTAVLILLLLVILSWLPRLRGPVDLRWDAAVYYVLGTSLSEGKGYRLLNEPGEIEAVIYPPLLPAVVAAHQRVLGTTDPVIVGRWLRWLFALLSLAYVLATYALLRSAARPLFALPATAVCSLTLLAAWLSDRCYTDLPFALALVAFVGHPVTPAAAAGARAGASAVAAFLLRTIGAALLLAWVAEAVVQRRLRRAGFRAAVALLPIVAWQLYIQRVEDGAGYRQPAYAYQRADYNIYNVTYGQLFSLRDHLNPELGHATPADRARRAVRALPAMIRGLGGAISQPQEHWELAFDRLSRIPIVKYFAPWRAIAVTMTLLGVLALSGLIVQLRRREVLLPVCTLVYVAGLCSMPPSYFHELPRYLWVLSPLLMLSAFHAVAALSRLRDRVPRPVAAIVVAGGVALSGFVIALGGFTAVRGFRTDLTPVVHQDWNGRPVEYRLFSYFGYEAFDGALEWLKREADPADVVASTTPQWVYLRTGLKSVFPPFEREVARAQALMDEVPIRYVVVADWLSRARALPAVEGSGLWRLVYSDREVKVYRRTSPLSLAGRAKSAAPALP